MTIYEGYSVLEERPNAAVERDTLWARNIFRLDPGPGARQFRDRAGVPIPEPRGFAWLLSGRAEIAAFRAWLDERRGRLVPFWAPTWRADLVLAQDAASGSSTLVVHNTGYTQYQFPHAARHHLAIRGPGIFSPWGEGAWGESPWGGTAGQQYRKVLSTVESVDTEELTLDSPLDQDVPSSALVSFLTLVRLASDEIEIVWRTSALAEAVADFVELPAEVPS